jgi:hypothetical protein
MLEWIQTAGSFYIYGKYNNQYRYYVYDGEANGVNSYIYCYAPSGYLGRDLSAWPDPSLVLTTFKHTCEAQNFCEQHFAKTVLDVI